MAKVKTSMLCLKKWRRGPIILKFLDCDLPIHYTTFEELQWRLRVVYKWASPLLRPFQPIFGPIFGWVTWPVNRESPVTYIWFFCLIFAYSLYNFHGATMTIKGSLQVSISIVKDFLTRNFSKFRRKLAQYFSYGGSEVEMFSRPQSTSLREKTSIDVLSVKIGAWGLGCRLTEEPKTSSSAIAERPRCRVGQFWPKVEDDILQTL